MEPKAGLLTFRAEGNNIPNSQYYSRVIHWPGLTSQCNDYGSGVTIGRGYDLKHRSYSEIMYDLTYVGVPPEQAKKIAGAAKLSHCKASTFVRENRKKIGQITESQQVRLFEKIYSDYVHDSVRFYNKYKKSNSVTWDKLHPILKDVFVDMKYQGRLTIGMVPVFGENDKNQAINLIKTNRKLLADEKGRNRAAYIESGMK